MICTCGNDRFIGHQVIYADVMVHSDGTFEENLPGGLEAHIYDAENPYTRREIQYLNDYYHHLESDFVLDNENLRDYARKVAKASLEADIAYDKKRSGKISSGELKEAQLMFDNLSKSAEFAACKRRSSDAGGLGSFGELIAKLENTGILQTVNIRFPKDDVDRVIADYRHILTAVGIDQASL